jgi:hypothetical protein
MGKGSGQQTTTTSQAIDPQIMGLLRENYDYAKGVSDRPYAAPDMQVAGQNPAQQQAYGQIQGLNDNRTGAPMLGQAADLTGQAGAYNPMMINPNLGMASQTGPAANFGGAYAGPAAQAGVSTFGGVDAGPAAQAFSTGYQAALMNRGDVRDVQAQSMPGSDLSGYMNPYESQVIQQGLKDNETARQMAALTTGAQATAAKAFGGSRHGIADAQRDIGYDENALRYVGDQRLQGFNTATALQQSDFNRAFQRDIANQGVDLSVAGTNAGMQTAANAFGAQAANTNSMYNTGQTNARGDLNAQLGQQTGLANMGALNQGAQYNAGNQQQTSLYNTGNAQSAGLANMQANNAFMQANADRGQGMSLANLGFANNAQAQNQSAGLTSNAQRLAAGGQFGQLSAQDLSQELSRTGALLSSGDAQQQYAQQLLNTQYQNQLGAWNYPLQQLQMRNSALGILPTPTTTTQTAPGPDRFGQVLGAGAQIASAALMFSDARTKQNVETVGYDDKGRRWVDFEYIFAPGFIRRGVIAQEVQKTDPHAVHDIGGVLHVEYGALA